MTTPNFIRGKFRTSRTDRTSYDVLFVLNNPQLPAADRGLRAVAHVELGEDVRDVILHRALGEAEAVGDLFVRGAVAEESENLALAARQRNDQGLRFRAACLHQPVERRDDAAGHGGLQKRLAAR